MALPTRCYKTKISKILLGTATQEYWYVVRCVVRPRDLSSSDAPRCSKDVDEFKFTNANGDALFAEVEYNTSLSEQELVDEEISRPQVPNRSVGLPL